MALQDSAMLVSLTITQWSARKLDRGVSYDVCTDKGADLDLGRFNKQIVPRKYLMHINQLVNQIRNYHYSNTLAWSHKGVDLLPGRHYMKYSVEMGDLQEKFTEAVKDFLNHYNTIIKQVENNLHGLYNKDDYPDVEQLRKKFHMQIDLTPVPSTGDFRIDINQTELDILKNKLNDQLEKASKQAEHDLFSRLYTAVAKAVITLREVDKIFRNTLIFNIDDICKKIPTMNFTDNSTLNKVAKDIYLIIMDIDKIDKLRDKDATYRLKIADQLANHMNAIETAYLGANNDDAISNTSTEDDQSTK